MVLWPAQFARIPVHARVLRESKDVAARAVAQHLDSEGQAAARPRPGVLDFEQIRARLDDSANPTAAAFALIQDAPYG